MLKGCVVWVDGWDGYGGGDGDEEITWYGTGRYCGWSLCHEWA